MKIQWGTKFFVDVRKGLRKNQSFLNDAQNSDNAAEHLFRMYLNSDHSDLSASIHSDILGRLHDANFSNPSAGIGIIEVSPRAFEVIARARCCY